MMHMTEAWLWLKSRAFCLHSGGIPVEQIHWQKIMQAFQLFCIRRRDREKEF